MYSTNIENEVKEGKRGSRYKAMDQGRTGGEQI